MRIGLLFMCIIYEILGECWKGAHWDLHLLLGTIKIMSTTEETPLIGEPDAPGLSKNQGILSVVNINVGLGLLGLPYAFKMTGLYRSMGLLFVMTAWSALASYFLMECFHHPKVKRAKVQGYAELGRFVLNKTGYLVTSISEIGWCFAASCAVFLNVVKTAMTFLPLSMFTVYGICVLLALPTVLAKDFKDLHVLSVLGSVTPFFLVVCITCISFFATPAEKPEPSGGISLGAGIFILCYTSSPAYPAIFSGLKNKSDSTPIVVQSFIWMFLINIFMGSVGLYIYGADTSIIIAQNLKVWPGSVAFYGMTSLLWVTLYCMVAPLNLLVCQSFQNVVRFPDGSQYRLLMFLCMVSVAYPFQTLVAQVEAFVGNFFGIIITFVLPTVFHYILYRKELSAGSKIVHWVSMIFGSLCCVLFTAQLFQ